SWHPGDGPVGRHRVRHGPDEPLLKRGRQHGAGTGAERARRGIAPHDDRRRRDYLAVRGHERVALEPQRVGPRNAYADACPVEEILADDVPAAPGLVMLRVAPVRRLDAVRPKTDPRRAAAHGV